MHPTPLRSPGQRSSNCSLSPKKALILGPGLSPSENLSCWDGPHSWAMQQSPGARHHLLPVHGPVLPSQQGVGSGRCGKDGPCRSICWDSNLGPTSGWEQNTEVQLPVRLLRRQLCISLCAYIITQQLSLLMWDTGQAAPTRSHGDVPALTSRQSFCHAWLQGLRTTPLFLPNRPLPPLLRTTAGSAGH